jgi:hypothetical protein
LPNLQHLEKAGSKLYMEKINTSQNNEWKNKLFICFTLLDQNMNFNWWMLKLWILWIKYLKEEFGWYKNG